MAAAAAPGLDGGDGGRAGGGGAPRQGGAEAAAGGGTAQVDPLGRGERRRRAKLGAPRPERLSRTVCRAAEEVVYCMNEAELVDVALAVLAEVSPDPRGWGRGPGPSRGLPRPAQLPSSPGRALLPSGLATGCPAGMGGLPLGTPAPSLECSRGEVAQLCLVVFSLVSICSARKVRRKPSPGAMASRSFSKHQTRRLEAQPALGRAVTTVWLSHALLTLVLMPMQRGQTARTLKMMF